MPVSHLQGLPPLPAGDDDSRDLAELVRRVNGFVYRGDRADAVVDVIRVLRADPDLAQRLLGWPAPLEQARPEAATR